LATILITDDEKNILDILGARLEHNGHTVLKASDGVEALEVLRHEHDRVNLVITDIRMPRMNGIELGQELRVQYKSLPVIYMSGYASEDVSKRAVELRQMGLPDNCVFLRLPFSEEELMRTVRTVLAG
jgi:two-component system cell cycle sensor histidine kinase/response regulator CckA